MRREEASELPDNELPPAAEHVGSLPQETFGDESIEGEPPVAAEAIEESGSVDETIEFASPEPHPLASESDEPAGEPLLATAENAAGEATPPRRARWLDPHNPFIEKPGPFMQLVLGRTTWQAPPPDAEEAGTESAPAATAPPPPDPIPPDQVYRPFDPARLAFDSSSATIAVSVQVSLTEEAIRRVAESSAAENAAKTQQQVELLARKIFALEQQIYDREANRRALARHWRHY